MNPARHCPNPRQDTPPQPIGVISLVNDKILVGLGGVQFTRPAGPALNIAVWVRMEQKKLKLWHGRRCCGGVVQILRHVAGLFFCSSITLFFPSLLLLTDRRRVGAAGYWTERGRKDEATSFSSDIIPSRLLDHPASLSDLHRSQDSPAPPSIILSRGTASQELRARASSSDRSLWLFIPHLLNFSFFPPFLHFQHI